MIKSTCNVVLDIKVISESPVQIKDFGMEKIYEITGEYVRTSGKTDKFIINYSDGLTTQPKFGDFITINGTLRNIIVNEESGVHYTKVYVLARNITILDSEPDIYQNEITLDNVELLNTPSVRKSYTDGITDISDIRIRVQRNPEKFNVFKCTSWNNNARLISNQDKGAILDIIGRIQSKSLKNGGLRTEISINSIVIKKEVLKSITEIKEDVNAEGSEEEERAES